MQYFECDYMEGAHPKILQRLLDTNMEKTTGYGLDAYCEMAKDKVRKACHCPNAQVHFLVGGTQTNAIVIKTLLRTYEGVLSAETGHINVHEAGAVETRGHKVLALPEKEGKISAESVEEYVRKFENDASHDHMVKPGMVYISHPTEFGSLYTKDELQKLSEVCRKHHLYLYVDGARMGYGLMAKDTDVTLETLSTYCDAFYIGGTKVGALFGEALVFPNPDLVDHFFTVIKQEGVTLAKGRLLGLQFDTLFTDDLYYKISKHAIDMAEKLKSGLEEAGCRFFYKSPTNQQFVIVDNDMLEPLAKEVDYSFWEEYDATHTIIRFVTSWATKEEDVDELITILKRIFKK